MLDADYLFNVADEIVELYEQLNTFGINDICRRLIGTDFQMTGSAEWQYYLLQQTGMSRGEINRQIARITKKSESEIKALFEETSYRSYNADMSIYEKAGITPLPFAQSERMLKILDATYRATLGELHNLTMTTADASQELLISTLNETQWKVITGMQSKNQALAEAIEKVAADGIDVMYSEGVKRSIESVVRMCVTTGINQACSQISLQNCKSMGTDLVLTSSHPGARTGDGYKGHVNWQGRVFSLSGNSKKYPSFESECGYGQTLGICGINCRHSFLPYIEGVSSNPFEHYNSKKDLEKYSNQQKQRRMEREIRTSKRQLQAIQASMNATAEIDVKGVLQEKYDKLAYKLQNQREKYNKFCDDNKLVAQPERMKVASGTSDLKKTKAWKKFTKANSGSTAKTESGKVGLQEIKSDDTMSVQEQIANADSQLADMKTQFSDMTDGYSYDDWFSDFSSIEEGYGEVSDGDEIFNKLKALDQQIKDTTQKKTELLYQKEKRQQLDTGYSGKVPDEELDAFNAKAFEQIKLDTGYSDEKATELQKALQEYFGGDYETILSGETSTAKVISDGLDVMPTYDGSISRGMTFTNADVKAFTDLQIGDELPQKGIIESWSSQKGTAIGYSGISDYERSSVILECENNETAVGVQHLSLFGTDESEVLSSSRYEVVEVVTENKYDYLLKHKEYLYSDIDLDEEADKMKENVVCIIKVKEKN